MTPEYAISIGKVITAWGHFESGFDGYIEFFRASPEAAAISEELPISFKKRSELFMASAKLIFASCPSLIERFRKLIVTARKLAKQRNYLAHGWIFDMSPAIFGGDGLFIIWRTGEGVQKAMSAKLSEIDDLVTDIRDLQGDLLTIFRGCHEDLPELTAQEKAALRTFHATHIFPPGHPNHRPPTGAPYVNPVPSFRA